MKEKAEKQENEVTTILCTSKDRFDVNKKYLEDINAEYTIEYHGSSESLTYKSTCMKFVDVAEKAGKGYHISKMVRKDIDAWLANHGEQLQPYGRTYREQLFNLNSIEKVIGIQGVSIDNNDCYWRTAYMIGYITERTYIMGLRKKEWKEGRNSAIGGLAAPYTRIDKIGKKEIKRYTEPPDVRYTYIRNHIIGHVYNVFYELFQQIGADFYMFLVDCVFTDYDRLKFVNQYLTNAGYRHKSKPIEFVNVDREKQRVSWYDFSAKCKGTKRCVKKCQCKNKYYDYSKSQLISDGLVEGKHGENLKKTWIAEKEAKKRDAIKELIKMSA